jgi:hypothetical protein
MRGVFSYQQGSPAQFLFFFFFLLFFFLPMRLISEAVLVCARLPMSCQQCRGRMTYPRDQDWRLVTELRLFVYSGINKVFLDGMHLYGQVYQMRQARARKT